MVGAGRGLGIIGRMMAAPSAHEGMTGTSTSPHEEEVTAASMAMITAPREVGICENAPFVRCLSVVAEVAVRGAESMRLSVAEIAITRAIGSTTAGRQTSVVAATVTMETHTPGSAATAKTFPIVEPTATRLTTAEQGRAATARNEVTEETTAEVGGIMTVSTAQADGTTPTTSATAPEMRVASGTMSETSAAGEHPTKDREGQRTGTAALQRGRRRAMSLPGQSLWGT